LTDDLYKYDVFLSYSASDAPVVREIAKGLRNEALRVWFSERPDRLSDEHLFDVNNALTQSRVLLLFISQHTMGDQWIQMEKQTLRFRDPANRERRFIPVRLDNSPLPDNLRQIESLEWNDEQAQSVLARLVAICAPPPPKPTARGIGVPRSASKKRHRLNPAVHIRTIKLDVGGRRAAYGFS
jgi:hypothetical protein